MIVITGRNVSKVPTPETTPSTTSPCNQCASGATLSSHSRKPPPKRTFTNWSSQSCIGAANEVVAWNTAQSTPSSTTVPAKGAVTTRSIRSVMVGFSASRSTTWLMTSAAQLRRRLASLRSSKSTGTTSGAGCSRAASMAACTSATHLPERGITGITGAPTNSASLATFTLMPRRSATSGMVNATTKRTGVSRNWLNRYRHRARLDASTIATTTSTPSRTTMSQVSSSSGETGLRLQVPGRSSNSMGRPPMATSALPTSTVVAGQLPILRCTPAMRENSVDLPTLGRPTSATTGRSWWMVRVLPVWHSEHMG